MGQNHIKVHKCLGCKRYWFKLPAWRNCPACDEYCRPMSVYTTSPNWEQANEDIEGAIDELKELRFTRWLIENSRV